MMRDSQLGLKPINEWRVYELTNKHGTTTMVSLHKRCISVIFLNVMEQWRII